MHFHTNTALWLFRLLVYSPKEECIAIGLGFQSLSSEISHVIMHMHRLELEGLISVFFTCKLFSGRTFSNASFHYLLFRQ